jgi:hypothetical protein
VGEGEEEVAAAVSGAGRGGTDPVGSRARAREMTRGWRARYPRQSGGDAAFERCEGGEETRG